MQMNVPDKHIINKFIVRGTYNQLFLFTTLKKASLLFSLKLSCSLWFKSLRSCYMFLCS